MKPARARRRPHKIAALHGTRVDPYYWLRDDSRKNKAVLEFIKAENAHTRQWFKHHGSIEKTLFAEIRGRLKQDDSSVPYLKNGYWYYVRYKRGREHPIYARRKGTMRAKEQIMLDGNILAARQSYFSVGAIEVSPDSNWIAYCEDAVGRREYTLRFKNLLTGRTLAAKIANVETELAWLNDSRQILYVAKDPTTLLGIYVKQHRIGTPSADDQLIFEQTDKTFYTTVAKSKSDRYVLLGMESTTRSEWRFADAAFTPLRFKTVLAAQRKHEYQIEHWRDELIIRTNWRAPNFRLMRVRLKSVGDRTRWREFIPHRRDTFIHDFDVMADYAAVSQRSGGLREIFVKPLRSAAGRGKSDGFFIAGDEAAHTLVLGGNPQIDSHTLRYVYTSMKTPSTVYDYDLRSGQRTLLKRDVVLGGFDADAYQSEFIFAPARDGKKIPISIIYKRGVKLNGNAPLLQYGYGAYGHSLDPAFSSPRLSLLDRGFVFALAHVRGGQELGRTWYDQGRLLNKRNTFYDFIDVTRHLVAKRYVDRRRVFAMGGSAGGLLMGAIANLAPSEYCGIIAQVPFVDVVTTMLDDTVPLTSNEYEEWGNPANKASYAYMKSYSPYDNVRAQRYPAMLVTTGLWDSQVQYYEPVKWVAKLRELKRDTKPLLLYVDMQAGHGGKSGRFERYREIAREYAFILAQPLPGGTTKQG